MEGRRNSVGSGSTAPLTSLIWPGMTAAVLVSPVLSTELRSPCPYPALYPQSSCCRSASLQFITGPGNYLSGRRQSHIASVSYASPVVLVIQISYLVLTDHFPTQLVPKLVLLCLRSPSPFTCNTGVNITEYPHQQWGEVTHHLFWPDNGQWTVTHTSEALYTILLVINNKYSIFQQHFQLAMKQADAFIRLKVT